MDPGRIRYRITADAFRRMVDAGILGEDDPVELVDGEIVSMSPQGTPHSMTVARVRRRLERAFGDGFWALDHSPVDGGPDSQPEPDVAIVAEPQWRTQHPGAADIPLIVEVAVTTQAEARAKAAVYAAAGFREYWIVDVPGRRIVQHRAPDPASRTFGEVHTCADVDVIEVAGGRVPVAELLPPG